jgi:opacity protein-like surface antigen
MIGKQTVIYHIADDQIIPGDEILGKMEESYNKIIIIDKNPIGITGYEIDTIYIQDTIFRIDTIRITDTIFIEKEKAEKEKPPKIKEIPVDFFQTETDRDKGWAMDFYAAPVLSDFSLVKDDVSFSLRNFSLGIDVLKLLNCWNFSIGLHFSHFGHRFSQQYSKTTGGVYQTDTVDVYYTVVDIDTSWYYVTDSSWIPLESRDYNYEKTNTIGYLGLNVSVAYDFYKSSKLRIYAKLGGRIGWAVYKNGIAIPDEEHAEGINFSDLQFNTDYSASIGAGLKYKITNDLDFNTELYYSRYFNQIVKEFEYDNRLNVIGLKIGIIYYF